MPLRVAIGPVASALAGDIILKGGGSVGGYAGGGRVCVGEGEALMRGKRW